MSTRLLGLQRLARRTPDFHAQAIWREEMVSEEQMQAPCLHASEDLDHFRGPAFLFRFALKKQNGARQKKSKTAHSRRKFASRTRNQGTALAMGGGRRASAFEIEKGFFQTHARRCAAWVADPCSNRDSGALKQKHFFFLKGWLQNPCFFAWCAQFVD